MGWGRWKGSLGTCGAYVFTDPHCYVALSQLSCVQCTSVQRPLLYLLQRTESSLLPVQDKSTGAWGLAFLRHTEQVLSSAYIGDFPVRSVYLGRFCKSRFSWLSLCQLNARFPGVGSVFTPLPLFFLRSTGLARSPAPRGEVRGERK